MAEVLGLIASGISVAQFAGSIVTSSLKVKALLDQVKDAPESLRNMLDHIELLTPILCEATMCGDEAPSSATPHLQQAMQKALTACQKAGEQLETLASSLKYQIDAARGGVRRKRAMVKVVLKRGTLMQYETRLQKAIQLLTLAQGTYTIALHRTQPEIIVSQIMSALAQSPRSTHSPTMIPYNRDQTQVPSPQTVTGRRISTRQSANALHERLHVGFAKVTGLVRIYTTSRAKDDPINNSTRERALRIQVQMPAWLCASVLDAVFSRSYAGWDWSLNMYGYLREGSVEFDLVMDAIYDDDVDAMHRLFQERRCSPLDWFVWGDDSVSYEISLLTYALTFGCWEASGYLLNYGAPQPKTLEDLGSRRQEIQKDEFHIETLLRHELNDKARMSCLASSWQDLNSFTDLVGRLWPYNEFYTAAYEDHRLELAILLARNSDKTWDSPSPAVFQHLCESSFLAQAGSSTTTKVLSCIAWALGNIVWYDPDVASKWYSAIRETALRLDKFLVMPEQQLLGHELVYDSLQLFPTSTPFTDMFLASMVGCPGHNRDSECGRQHKIGHRLANCEGAIQMWLSILRDMGINLLEYGRRERQRLKNQENGYEFTIWRGVWHDEPYSKITDGLFEVRLIGFEYGRQPGDWKLWWSEPTDNLVGDFWKEMEPEPLRIPGSWDEDF